MAKRRRTVAEREQDRMDRTAAECQRFIRRFEKIGTFDEAVQFVSTGPRSDQPGHEFCARLGFLLHAFTLPSGATAWEIEMYLAFLRRLDAVGGLKPGHLQELEERCVAAIKAAT
jgi:hypothetical protein